MIRLLAAIGTFGLFVLMLVTIGSMKPQAANSIKPEATTNTVAQNSTLVDSCVREAVGKVPKEHHRVTSTKTKYSHSGTPYGQAMDFWEIFVAADVFGKPVHYHWFCRVWSNETTELIHWSTEHTNGMKYFSQTGELVYSNIVTQIDSPLARLHRRLNANSTR